MSGEDVPKGGGMSEESDLRYEYLMQELKRLLIEIAEHDFCPQDIREEIKQSPLLKETSE